MGPIDAIVMLLAACATVAYSIRVIAQAAVKYQAQQLQIERQSDSAGSDDRLARVEVAVESIAVAVESIALEVERVSEGQRFTTKLLNDVVQHSAPRLAQPAKVNTPH